MEQFKRSKSTRLLPSKNNSNASLFNHSSFLDMTQEQLLQDRPHTHNQTNGSARNSECNDSLRNTVDSRGNRRYSSTQGQEHDLKLDLTAIITNEPVKNNKPSSFQRNDSVVDDFIQV